ncbi:helix-turn-helix domain-containing protein [Treponema brennaborense]|uniref:Helix-turn-helix domain protein n=1 Tax=Treponema brennaborense (strain DSM 12168 / CIP 105900 / DD5/3) TaxID=906968 RepID=F4LL72_TREBD|nr:helix-turn-helix transcriptional regulator [Treponema brennaborense]AEE17646.1 helix-turn-helix domain protein [Treponema brennaborense DSM 12168]
MTFWERVEILREEQNTSYRWIAAQMGVSETTVSSMRKAGTEPRAGEAVKIAKALGTTVEFLAGAGEDEYYKKYVLLKSALRELLTTN